MRVPASGLITQDHPNYELTFSKRFEITDLCVIFFNKYVSHVYLLSFSLYVFATNWTYAAVASSAWASNIPFRHLGLVEKCTPAAFLHQTLPTGECLYAYYFSLSLFAVIVIFLSMLDLKEQAVIQLFFGIVRFFTLGLIIVYCIVRLAQRVGDACQEELRIVNFTYPVPINVEITPMILHFNIKGWLVSLPVFVYAFSIHSCLASMMYPMEKKLHHWLLLVMVVVTACCYVSVGLVVSLWFRAATHETCTLSWVSASMPAIVHCCSCCQ